MGFLTAAALALSAGATAYGASQAGKGGRGGGGTRNLTNEGLGTLDAYGKTLPMQLNLGQRYNPQFAALQGDTLNEYLLGSGGVQDTSNRATSLQRSSDAQDYGAIGQQYRNAFDTNNPQIAQLLQSLLGDAQGGLDAGAGLDPGLARTVRQSVRGGQSARGMAFGPSAVYEEAMSTGAMGNQLRNERRQFAGNVIGLQDSVYGAPLRQAMSERSRAFDVGQQIAPSFGQTTDPYSNYASDLYGSNSNAAYARQASNANNRAAITGAGIGALGKLGGAYIGTLGGGGGGVLGYNDELSPGAWAPTGTWGYGGD